MLRTSYLKSLKEEMIYKDPYSVLSWKANQQIDYFIKTGNINHFLLMINYLYIRNSINEYGHLPEDSRNAS